MQHRNNKASEFTRAIGEQQGRDAHDRAQLLRQPGGSAIYFGVDYDVSPQDLKKCILPYFQGVLAAFDQKQSPYLVGAYGSALVLEEVQKLKLIKFAWLPGSTGWGYGRYKPYLASNQWNLHQKPDTQLCGFSVDINRCRDLFAAGLFTPPPP